MAAATAELRAFVSDGPRTPDIVRAAESLNVADLRAYWNRLRPVCGKRVRIDAR